MLYLMVPRDTAADNEREAYIVYMGRLPDDVVSLQNDHFSMISQVVEKSIDRKFINKLVLTNGSTFTGRSIIGFNTPKEYLPIVYGKELGNGSCDEYYLKACFRQCIQREKVAGKIVLCNNTEAVQTIGELGPAGLVVPADYPDYANVEPLPSAYLTTWDFEEVVRYHDHARNPTGKIFKSTTDREDGAPFRASFSSYGPNTFFPNIMKPDISAPGIDILAAYSLKAPPSTSPDDPRRVAYNVLTGTSMACPHVAGVAAYVKSFHPDWSPSAIKSAIMTTAQPMMPQLIYEYGYGSGQVDPVKALSPGLVYEIPKEDYLRLLCTKGINVTIVAGKNHTCRGLPKLNVKDVNYPSISLIVHNDTTHFSANVSRTVRNVGPTNSTYKLSVVADPKVNITVEPDVLYFDAAHHTRSFTVSVAVSGLQFREIVSSELAWSDGTHSVRSPIVLFKDNE
ncbi:hypothetical protein MLD38_009267 [Melastoma candidum]|uniref:Uncharacterized protein n=1 Tax=Melastoma candidum TaxID=119954 RepID=A0ACB9RWY5_9MYRT|nr:hypothetical protein MLD38_009267 [Melastoma candidum]